MEYPVDPNTSGNGRRIALLTAALVIIGLAVSVTLSNIRNSINHTSDNSRNGLSDDLPIKPSVPEFSDTNTIQAFGRALNENRGTKDIHILTTHIEGLEPYSEIVLPQGLNRDLYSGVKLCQI
ncbi:MAG TPA: hypothetical protein PKU78_02480 [Candidatus Dojkabacteria bacterium]|nr:hypothetical protein [Candidatus Dojkabacteria bacterium]HRO65063.1 hypothetical protein [Candidatus Dojkabacteria bacterium]HRP36689.1 hypothetical protein [Candidatus Dojkabacteria bacterium]HRP51189.1 hypothetical protein [Candidatus Dojkabacteria bacterium]